MSVATQTGELCIMHPDHGDLKVVWDRNNPDEVDAAREQFNRLKKKGYFAYSVEGPKGEKGELLKEFDPSAEKIILAPRTTGG